MARRKKPGDDEILRWADELAKLGRDPAVFLQRAVLGEESFLTSAAARQAKSEETEQDVRKRVSLAKLQSRVTPSDLLGLYSLYSPTVLHDLFKVKLALSSGPRHPDYRPDDYTDGPYDATARVPCLPELTLERKRWLRQLLKAFGRALDGDLQNVEDDRFRVMWEARELHEEIRTCLANGARSVDEARTTVAGKHGLTPNALRRRIDRGKQYAADMKFPTFFLPLRSGRSPK